MDPVYEEKVYRFFEAEIPKVLKEEDYRILDASICKGVTPYHTKETKFLLINHDLIIDGVDLFSGTEAFDIQRIALKFGARMPRAHEWRLIAFWITYGGEYVKKFGFVHRGHTWEHTNIPQTQDNAAYYWSSSRNHNNDNEMRAIRVFDDGQFDTPFRPKGEKMGVRLIILPELLKKLSDAQKVLDAPIPLT